MGRKQTPAARTRIKALHAAWVQGIDDSCPKQGNADEYKEQSANDNDRLVLREFGVRNRPYRIVSKPRYNFVCEIENPGGWLGQSKSVVSRTSLQTLAPQIAQQLEILECLNNSFHGGAE